MSSGRKFTVEFKVKAVELAKKLGRPEFEDPRWMKYKLEVQDWDKAE